MFEKVRLHGGTATILWGYRPAVKLAHWSVRRQNKILKGHPSEIDNLELGQWTLTGVVQFVEPFHVRQTPLLFAVPREKGFWMWPVEKVQIAGQQLRAKLGPPEQ